jgi:hypothetical protein
MPRQIAIDQAWCVSTATRDVGPIADALIGELGLTVAQDQRLAEGLAACFIRGIKAATIEISAQLVERDPDTLTLLTLKVDDGWES